MFIVAQSITNGKKKENCSVLENTVCLLQIAQ